MRLSENLTASAKRGGQVSVLTMFLAASVAFIFAPSAAHAVMKGQSAGSISRHVVKLVGHNLLCTATVIGRDKLLTANHCVEGTGPFHVIAAGRQIAVASHSAAGQVTQLTLASPLPPSIVPIETGTAAADGTFTIAGYGTAHESERMHSAGLKEARLVADAKYGGLVDPKRRGPISASACMGDSGGPVAKFDGKRYVLVGIVERVSNYAGVGACGFLTHFSAVSGNSTYASAPEGTTRQASEPRAHRVAAKKHQQRYLAAAR
ncbi:MAG: trypsin-like serine protease [Xanthobacteraceae bacterium]